MKKIIWSIVAIVAVLIIAFMLFIFTSREYRVGHQSFMYAACQKLGGSQAQAGNSSSCSLLGIGFSNVTPIAPPSNPVKYGCDENGLCVEPPIPQKVQSPLSTELKIVSPKTDEILKSDSSYVIKWTPTTDQNSFVNIELISRENCVLAPCPMPPAPGVKMPKVAPSQPLIANNIPNTGAYSWKVGSFRLVTGAAQSGPLVAPEGGYRIQICELAGEGKCVSSDSYFSISSK